MENTLQNKARFFAQYWGQAIVIWNLPERATDPLSVGCRALKEIDKNDYLLLKPLQSISDEDAVEVAKAFDKDLDWRVDERNDHFVSLKALGFVFWIWFDTQTSAIVNAEEYSLMDGEAETCEIYGMPSIIDTFRKKGYAIEFNGLSVEQQIEFGWVRLTD